MATNGKDTRGRFAPGNPGGPGRPRRDTEREYLAALSEECDLDTWRAVVRGAVEAAKGGDAKAREWLARYLVGSPAAKAPDLFIMAVDELRGRDPVLRAAKPGGHIRALLDDLG